MVNHPNRSRERTIKLSPGEARAALAAISEMTYGNGRDFSEWNSQTHRSHAEWRALLRAEAKIEEAAR